MRVFIPNIVQLNIIDCACIILTATVLKRLIHLTCHLTVMPTSCAEVYLINIVLLKTKLIRMFYIPSCHERHLRNFKGERLLRNFKL